MSELIGQTLGRYRIVEKIGAGGMGEVYRAKDATLDREVAVKVLPQAMAQDEERLARFQREARAVAKLDHPNILAIHDFGIDQGVTFAVTELLKGETLRERLEGGALSWRKAAETGPAIAEGLAAAHGAGIIHRDLKPDNIFLTSDGRVKILDFGLARDVEAAAPGDTRSPTVSRYTDPGAVMGTAGYMSPEQVRGDTVDQRSDIFSLGCVLHEMLSGQRAFAGDTAVETMNAILKEEPSEISTSGEALPAELAGTVRRCLEKRPESRFQSASDLAYNLRSLSSASTASPPRPARRFAGQRKAFLWLPLAAVVALGLVWLNPGGWRSSLLRPEDSAASGSIDSLAVLPFANIVGDEDTKYLSDGIPASIIDRLSKLAALRVVPRSTAFHFRGPNQDLAEVARRLDVNAILTGQIQARDEALVIRVELVDVNTDRQLWGERLTGTLDDILATEERIATRVSEALRVELSGEDRARLARRGTSSPEAHRHYLKGRHHMEGRTEEGLRKAIESFSDAIEEDPTFALAYCGLADSWILLADYHWEPLEDVLPRARDAVEKALALEDNLAEAHASLGLLSEYEWDGETAEQEYRRALELNPRSVDARRWYAWFLTAQGRPAEGISEIRRAMETDPLSAQLNRLLAAFLHSAHRYEEALEQIDYALELNPGTSLLLQSKGRILASMGRYDEALAEFERCGLDDRENLGFLGWAYALAGRRDAARDILDKLNELSRQTIVGPWEFAIVHAGLGENDLAFKWLQMGLMEPSPMILCLKFYPEWDPIRDDPRFAELISSSGYFNEN